jgi:hypothetical protein
MQYSGGEASVRGYEKLCARSSEVQTGFLNQLIYAEFNPHALHT